MKKTLLLVLTVCMMAVMVPAVCFAEGEEAQAPQDPVLAEEELTGGEPAAQEQEYFDYESKMSIQEGEPGWQQDPETQTWRYWDGTKFLTDKQKIGGVFYYFDGNGVMKTGWVQLADGDKNYYDPTPGTPGAVGSTYGVMKTGWLKLKKNKYYLDTKNGAMYVGLKTISGSKYFFNTKGVMQTGWVTYEDHKYYMSTKNGRAVKGWQTISKKKYYFDEKKCSMKTGWVKIKNDYYYFDSKGVMQTGWITVSGKKYYADSKGRRATGFKTISKKKYYFNSKGVMQTGLNTIKGYKYYFDSKGVMKTGAVKIKNDLYYFYSSGKAVKNAGWFKGSDKKQRYSLGGGKIATGTKKIGNITYVFSTTTGLVIRSMDQYDSRINNVKSSTKYLIQVIKGKHQVRVYSGKKGDWTKIYTFTCSIGDKENPTPQGTFKIYKKLQKHEVKDELSGVKIRCWGLCRFYKDDQGKEYALNSIIYRASDGSVYDGRLGVNNSRGSVRLSYNNAMWVFYNAPINTTVFVGA